MNEKHMVIVQDEKGFNYEVEFEHKPHHGFSTAYYKGDIIGQVELGKLSMPYSDDDEEWERYEHTLSEWKDEIMSRLKPICEKYFNKEK